MSLRPIRRPVIVFGLAAFVVALYLVLLRAMAHGHSAHAFLSAGHSPPAGPALIAFSFVVVRILTIVFVPGALLAAAAEIVAYLLVGPRRASTSEAEGG